MIVARQSLCKYSDDLYLRRKIVTDDKTVTIFDRISLYLELIPEHRKFEPNIRRWKHVYRLKDIPPFDIETGVGHFVDNTDYAPIESVSSFYSGAGLYFTHRLLLVNVNGEVVGSMYATLSIDKGKFTHYERRYSFESNASEDDIHGKFNVDGRYVDGKLEIHKYPVNIKEVRK